MGLALEPRIGNAAGAALAFIRTPAEWLATDHARVSGAVVALGRSSARTGVSGRAALIAPSTGGPYRLTAARPGSVPAFPETVLVR